MFMEEPFRIGSLSIPNRVLLAPLAGVTDRAFRVLCKEQGAGLVYSEMISAKGVHYRSQNSLKLAELDEREQPAAIQLFGSEPDIMAEAAVKFQKMGAALIDINMGCPTPKITANGDGAALMRDPERAGKIVRSVSQAVTVPVTVKLRRGYALGEETAPIMALAVEENGAKAVTIHGRYREQFYAGKNDRAVIKTVKKILSIPVIANGDILTPADAKSMLEETGADAVMIGRGALGNPWIFRETIQYLRDGQLLPPPSQQEMAETIRRHIQMVVAWKGEWIGLREMRKHLAWYTKGMKNAASLRKRVFQVRTEQEAYALIDEILSC